MKTLLIAPWGKPDWDEVTYIYNKEKIKSRTSLVILQRKLFPERTIIIALDTLATSGNNYEEVVKNAEETVEAKAKEFGIENFDIIIAPGVGGFPHGRFSGAMLDYYYFLIYRISKIVVKLPQEIHLDLTHGINFMPVLTYRVLREILGIINIFKKVRFIVYNADPYTKSISREIHVNIVEDTNPAPAPINEKMKDLRMLKPAVEMSPAEIKAIFQQELKIPEEPRPEDISAFLGALYNGFPLALFSFFHDPKTLDALIQENFSIYKKHIKVEKENELHIKRELKFTNDFKVCLFARLTAELLKKKRLISKKQNEVKIEDIENLNKNLFSYDKRIEQKITNDLYKIKQDMQNRILKEWKIYNEIRDAPVGRPDLRNFIAHSGFEYNTVELKKDHTIYLRYSEGVIKEVRKFCCKGMV